MKNINSEWISHFMLFNSNIQCELDSIGSLLLTILLNINVFEVWIEFYKIFFNEIAINGKKKV